MNKFKSRKLLAFLIWTGIVLFVIVADLAGDISSQMVEVLSLYSYITLVYIGGQSAIDFIDKKKERIEK